MTSPNRNYTRIETLELKALIVKNVGHRRADKYFHQLRRLFSLKISKSQFDRFCIRTIGRENIPLHNQLMTAILKNACLAKLPSLRGSAIIGSALSVDKVSNGQRYRDAFPRSPRRVRYSVGQERTKDRQSHLRPLLGKHQTLACGNIISKAQEQQSATELHSLGSKPPVSVEDGEEVEQMAGSPSIQSRSPVTAPLGISMNSGCGRQLLFNVSVSNKHYPETCQSSGELPDTMSLKSRLEQKLEKEGLTISVDCVNLLNNGLDTYLKSLIESFMVSAESRGRIEHLKHTNSWLLTSSNVMLPGRYMQTATTSAGASVLDFRIAIELNPQVLGPDWPIQLEKISLHASEYEE